MSDRNTYHSDYNKTRYNERKAKSICVKCGEQPAAQNNVYCDRCKHKRTEHQRKYAKNKRDNAKALGICRECFTNKTNNGLLKCTTCSAVIKNQVSERRKKLKLEVFRAYGGPVCHCCGKTEIKFLQIDHINGDGAKERKEISGNKRSCSTFYTWLKKNKFPPGYQVLCASCNTSKGTGTECVHKRKMDELLKGAAKIGLIY